MKTKLEKIEKMEKLLSYNPTIWFRDWQTGLLAKSTHYLHYLFFRFVQNFYWSLACNTGHKSKMYVQLNKC